MTTTVDNIESTVRAFYAEIDANAPEAFDRRLAPDAVFAFNDVDPVKGAQEIAGFVGAWKSNFRSVTHSIEAVTVDRDRGRTGIEVDVTYTFTDGREVGVRGCSFLDIAADRITGWRVYVDTSRLS
jgi:ketosteroid isomerase-like protein